VKTSTLSFANFMEGNILLKECTQTINNEIKLHILGVPAWPEDVSTCRTFEVLAH